MSQSNNFPCQAYAVARCASVAIGEPGRGHLRIHLQEGRVGKRKSLILVAMVAALSLAAHADNWEKSYQVSGRAELRLDAKDGNVQLSAWDKNEIHARVITE